MIRADMPLPAAIRIRLRADAAAEGFAYRVRTVRKRFVGVIRNDFAAIRSLPQLMSRGEKTIPAAHFTANPEARKSMHEFVSRYDDLVDLLCWTAKEGVSDHRRARYSELRLWFVQNYEPVRPVVTRFLDTLPEDRDPVAADSPPPRDAFESLFLPFQIDALIHSEAVIHRIMRTRCAVEACRQELAKELERECVPAG